MHDPMTTAATTQGDLASRLARVRAHIEDAGERIPPLAELAAVAGWSPFHFHRVFRAATGSTVARYVQEVRLHRAAFRLAFRPDDALTDIALDAGYATPDAFARAFRRRCGQSPGSFRRAPQWARWSCMSVPTSHEDTMAAHDDRDTLVTIETRDDQPIALLVHCGPPQAIPATIQRFIAWRRRAGVVPPASPTFNLLYDDPGEVPPEAFRMGLAAGMRSPMPCADGEVVPAMIAGGRVAVLRHVGDEASLGRAIDWLYRDWWPRSGASLRDAPLYLQRVRFYPDVPADRAETHVMLPLAD